MIRWLRVARATAMKARTQAINALKGLVITAPEELREQLRGLISGATGPDNSRAGTGSGHHPGGCGHARVADPSPPLPSTHGRAHNLGYRTESLTTTAAPKLLALFGVGSDSAGALLVAAGDNPGRLRSNAAFAMLCGASPIEASSGKTRRHRLNRGGDRQANAVLYRIVIARLRHDQQTRTTWPAASASTSPRRKHPLFEALCGPRGVRRPPDEPPLP
jgi:transposase